MKIKQLGRVAFLVRDMDKVVDFFSRNFGMRFLELDAAVAKRDGARCCVCHEMQLELVSPILPLADNAPPPVRKSVEMLKVIGCYDDRRRREVCRWCCVLR
jgi:catechol 2,3-dioxygenase-like lactoylglutathione lyase family enzyme